MKFFDNMKVSLKLSALIVIATISMGIIGLTGYYYIQNANTNMKNLYQDHLVPIELINENQAHINKVNGAVIELMVTTDNKRKDEIKQIVMDRAKNFNANLGEIEKANLDVHEREKIEALKGAMKKYREARTLVIELASQNKNAEAYAVYASSVEPLANDALAKCMDLSKYSIALSEKLNEDNQVSAAKATQIMFGIVFLCFILLGVSGLYITKTITKPLTMMVTLCGELSAGDFRDKPRKFVRNDEIGQLADSLIDMKSSLRKLMRSVNDSSEQLAASSEELTASADQSAQASNQVAIAITVVATGAEQQAHVATETTTVVEQMSASIEQIAMNASEVAGQSSQAAEKAMVGNKSVDKAVEQMANIEQTVTTSAKVVAQLGERSKEIGQIVDTISGIAGQTNLLALNAAIEAARAGEQGRGFAVVAEEVRKLAEQSQDAAKQIATLIGAIQGDTEKAVVAMNNGTREVKLGAEVVNASGAAFQEIATLVTQVSEQTQEIFNEIEQMASGSQQIVESVKQINELSKRSSGESQTVSAATEEQSASMEEIAASSQALAQLAMNLRNAVSKFQI